MYDARTLHGREVLERVVQAFGDTVFHTVIARTVRFPDATVAGEPITTFSPVLQRRHRPTANLAVEVVARSLRRPWSATGREPSTRRRTRLRCRPRPWTTSGPGFTVRLTNFDGPFDLLLQLIGKHKLDVTEVALSVVTDDFIAHISDRLRRDWDDLDETTEFLLIAATLVDLKAARLLPQGEVEDEADLDLLEARDLLFARLLQYRAYKQMAGTFETELMATAPRRYPRSVTLEDRFAALLPDVLFTVHAEAVRRPRGPGDGHPAPNRRRVGAPARTRGQRPRARPSWWSSGCGRLTRSGLTFADLIADSPTS